MAGHKDGTTATRSVILSLRVTEEEAAVLQAEADRTETSVSDVLRNRAFKYGSHRPDAPLPVTEVAVGE